MIILGFDYGQKKIGVATGHTLTRTTTPLCQIAAQKGIPHWYEMDKLFQEWRPKIIVVGLPFHSDGTESPLVPKARIFGQTLEKRYAHYELTCHYVDEHLTSFEARQLVQVHKTIKAKKPKVDAIAAMLIVEIWLSSQVG